MSIEAIGRLRDPMVDDVKQGIKRRKLELAASMILDQFNDGNIVKIKLTNFVTYSKTEFNLSPTLNMIIGPNGTGKSTFVCAICLGLAGKPELLGRQKYAVDFIKEGERECIIETTLRYSNTSNGFITIKRKMTRNESKSTKEKSEWWVDGVRKEEKTIHKILKLLNIQLNNLCCFLPQDKVSSFAGLKPEDLLRETERATDPKLLEQHEELISLDEEKATYTKEIETNQATLQELERGHEHHKQAAEKFMKYKMKQEELSLHERLLPYAVVNDRKKKAEALKMRKNSLKQKYHEFLKYTNPFDEEIGKLSQKINRKANEIESLKSSSEDLKQEQLKGAKEKDKIEKEIERLQNEKIKLETRSERKRQELMSVINEIAELKAELDGFPEIDEDAYKELVAKKREYQVESTRLKEKLIDLEESSNESKRQKMRVEKRIEIIRQKMKSNDKINILDRGGSQFREAKEAVKRLRQHPEFEGKVFEPPILSLNVTDNKYVKFFENLVDSNNKLAFTCIDKNAYNEVSSTIFKGINVSLRVVGREQKRAISFEQAQALGYDGYLIDFIDGPEPVKKMLYESMYDVPVRMNDLSAKELEQAEIVRNSKVQFSLICAGNTIYRIRVSKYGSRQAVCSAEEIVQKNQALFDTRGASQGLENQLIEYEAELSNIMRSLNPINEKQRELNMQRNKLKGDYDHVHSEQQRINSLRSKIDTLQSKIARKEETKNDLAEQSNRDVSAAIIRVETKIGKLIEQKLTSIGKYVGPIVEMNQNSSEILRLQFEILDMQNRQKGVEKMLEQLQEFGNRFSKQVEIAQQKYNKVKNSDEVKRLREKTANYSDELRSQLADLSREYMQKNELTEIHIATKISNIKTEISSLEDASSSSIDRLQNIENKLKEIQKKLPDLQTKLQVVKERILEIKEPWEKRLDDLAQRVSSKFSEKFVAVASAGEVRLSKPEKLSDWKLELLVMFRDNTELRVLDSYIQSGGERAVSTIFFMLALQGLASSPFRVVDEINQGMDPKNESIVHKNMVESACQSDSDGNFSQYFLITPKLLTNLYYHEKMAIHCIMANHRFSNF